MTIKKKSHLAKFVPYVLSISMLTTLAACNGDNDDDNDSPTSQEEQELEGFYHADLKALNSSVAGSPSGIARIAVVGDEMIVNVDMDGVPIKITHLQHVHGGSTCPTVADDANSDGFIDVVEGVPAYGPILIPLDSDLRTQEAGRNGFPRANASGSYRYIERVSVKDILDDLTAADPNPDDAVVKLEQGESLNLEGRHIVIHGVPANTTLPDTVQSLGELPATTTLPIACGEIVRDLGRPEGESTSEE